MTDKTVNWKIQVMIVPQKERVVVTMNLENQRHKNVVVVVVVVVVDVVVVVLTVVLVVVEK